MPWQSAAISGGLSLAGGLMGGGSKSAERAAKDSAARAAYTQDQARRQALEMLDPYTDLGRGASTKLAQMLGVADPTGYAKRPELQDFVDQLRNEHFQWAGRDYNRNSNIAGQNVEAKKRYDDAMQQWEAGKSEYLKQNPNAAGEGELLRAFSNEDFVQEPGREFRVAEGEKGINRSLAARGGYNSGAALKALDRYNQDYASNEFFNAYNRDAANKARTFSFLSGASGQGLQAAGAGVGAGQNAANQSSQIESNLGSNLANMYTNNADNQSNMFQSAIGNALYAYERNKPVTGSTQTNPGGYTTTMPTYSSGSTKPWYLS